MIEFQVLTNNGWRLVATPEILAIHEFRMVVLHDQSKDKKQATQDLLYVWGMEEKNKKKNPYAELHFRQKDEKVRYNTYGDEQAGPKAPTADTPGAYPERWALIQDAIAAYRYYNHTSETRLMDTLDQSIDVINDFIRKALFNSTLDEVSLGKIIGHLGKVETLLTNKKKAEKLLNEGLAASLSKAKGGVGASPLERGLLDSILLKNQRRGVEETEQEETLQDEQ